MEATKEELKAAFKDLLSTDPDFRRELRGSNLLTGSLNPKAKAFKDKAREELGDLWVKQYGKDATGSHHLTEAFNTIIRFQLKLKSVARLTDSQVPAAEKLLAEYKHLLSN